MSMRIAGLELYGISDMRKGYNIYLTNALDADRNSKNKHHVKVCNTITLARKDALAIIRKGNYKFAVIYKGMNERAEGALYLDGRIPCWVNETHNYIVNDDGSIRNGVKYR